MVRKKPLRVLGLFDKYNMQYTIKAWFEAAVWIVLGIGLGTIITWIWEAVI